MNYRFVFARKGYNKEGKALVQLRVTIARQSKFFSTGIYLEKNQWDEDARAVKAHPKRFVLNANLRAIADRLDDYYYKQLKAKKPASFLHVQALMNSDSAGSFIDFCRKEAENAKLRPGTVRHLKSFSNILELSGAVVLFSDLTIEALHKFDAYLSTRGINKNTQRKKHATFRRMINAAIQKGLVDENPYSRYTMLKGQETTRRYLGREDLELLKGFKGTEKQERVRDCFLFQCYTGIAYQDMKDLRQGDLMIHNGTPFIVLNRVKTGEESAVPILPQAHRIIEKYQQSDKGASMLPATTNQHMNRMLKDIRAALGIKQELTTHVARHTFATTITLENGVPIETVSRILGHAKISTTQIYAKITRDKLASDMQSLAGKLKGDEDN